MSVEGVIAGYRKRYERRDPHPYFLVGVAAKRLRKMLFVSVASKWFSSKRKSFICNTKRGGAVARSKVDSDQWAVASPEKWSVGM
jgi:hypothetical protein